MRKSIDEVFTRRSMTSYRKLNPTSIVDPTLFRLHLFWMICGKFWIEYKPGEPQHKWSHTQYVRTDEQNVQVGIITRDQLEQRRQEQLKQLIP
ncbi:ALI_collapsed_G0025400.mRNA.1.CDS.1 [Saccharomyces cerevisiae]|nr:ALI_collapsed_G0025400.mRNA.1.CDS.1 [Saccharomyces cerevisiae]